VKSVWAVALLIASAYVVQESLGRTTHGFIAYYAAARLFVSGEFDRRVYDDEWFEEYVQGITKSDVREIYGPNTPAMALLATPVAVLGPHNARTTWLLAALVVLALASAAFMRYATGVDRRVLAVLVAVMLLNPPVFANLRTGQAYIFVFGAFMAIALLLVRGRDVAAGIVLGLTLVIKSTGWPLLVLLAVQRRLRALGTAVVVAGATAALVMAVVGLDTWLAYPPYVEAFLNRPAASVTAYQTTRSLVRHLCIGDPVWNPAPAASCAGAAEWIPMLVTAIAVAVTAFLARGARSEHWVAAGIVLAILAAPVGAEQHYASLAVPIGLLIAARARSDAHGLTPHAAHGLTPHGAHGLTPVAVVAILWLIPLEYTALRFTDGWSALLAYPRLYAGWAVWALVLREMLPNIAATDKTVWKPSER
jgi:hypothetical protein